MSEKNKPGYISRYRRINLIWLIVWIIIGVAIVLTGWFIWHTRANILTVLGVLMVLPGAKRIIALIAAGRKKSVSEDRIKAIEELIEGYSYAADVDTFRYEDEEGKEIEAETVFWTDYIFTSSEKIMMLDFMVEKEGFVFAQPTARTDNFEYVKKYLTDVVNNASNNYKIYFVNSDEELIKALKKKENSERKISPVERLDVVSALKSLAV
ncbi:MAG: hypothetical protein K5639_04935 [Eubacterium sp.]|nr:hypothetical protein [Eubacterium sp.]